MRFYCVKHLLIMIIKLEKVIASWPTSENSQSGTFTSHFSKTKRMRLHVHCRRDQIFLPKKKDTPAENQTFFIPSNDFTRYRAILPKTIRIPRAKKKSPSHHRTRTIRALDFPNSQLGATLPRPECREWNPRGSH